MSLSNTPASERTHIAFFGRRNAGKSSLINAITNQELSIVSDTPGTTTDPVRKTMELLPLGPVVIIDTPGVDDVGELGEKRVKQSLKVLNETDIAIVVLDGDTIDRQIKNDDFSFEKSLLEKILSKNIPYIFVCTKNDKLEIKAKDITLLDKKISLHHISATSNAGIEEIKEAISKLIKTEEKQIVSDLLKEKDIVVLVIPIDDSAPKGRLILPQQLVIRDLLDHGMIPICCKDSEIDSALASLKEPPALVITDSQVFNKVSKIIPENVSLTSFSILMARHKGILDASVKGANCLDSLKDNDKVLISEGCTHHRQCEDIGTVKLPGWIKKYTNADISYDFTSGRDFPDELNKYKLIVHCGGCMLNGKEMESRYKCAREQNVSITNYGTIIAKMNGILDRSISIIDRR